MFTLYHHHDLSRLADVLTALRRSNTLSPLATDSVLVPNIGLGRWLKMHIAERDGISVNISTALPAPFFWQLVADSLPGDRPDSSAYRRENLRWHLYALLPLLANEVPEVGNYLTGTSLELRRWQLAERLADLFDQYLIYRREMLLGWERGESENSPPASSLSDLSDRREPSGRARTVFHDFEAHSCAMQREIGEKWTALPTGAVDQSQVRQAASWQAPVWRLLVTRLGPNHRARLLGEFVQHIVSGAPLNTDSWPKQLYCFGLGNLPPDYLRLLYAIGRHTDVHFLMHNPSDIYWGDIEKRPTPRDVLLDGEPLPGEELVFTGHPLLASLGYAGRDFLRLIYSDEFSGIREIELGEVLTYTPPDDDTLLHRLQAGVIRMEACTTPTGIDADDHSLQVHACHGVLREVQVLHDQLLGLLARDPTLQPRDIIVMTPAIADFAPVIEAVFGSARGLMSIPFNTSDQPRRASHPIVLIFRALLDLPLWRWTASELIGLVNVPAVMKRYALESAEVSNLQQWIAAAGIRWGIDADHRAQSDAGHWSQNSWSFGLDRLLVGVTMSDPDTLAAGVAGVVDLEGGATAALGQLWLLIERLKYWRNVLPAQASALVWQERLNTLCSEVFLADNDDRDEQRALQTVFEAIAALDSATDAIAETPLSWEAVREIIDGELEDSGARQPFLAGGVSFCGLVPLRTVPFRVVCLLGMNEGVFPRQDLNRSINLIRRHPRLGDASVRDDDRLLFLQWLLAARDVFYISYTGQDTSSGEAMEPSTVVAELLDFIVRDQFAPDQRINARQGLITRQPMQPFSPRYFNSAADVRPIDPRVFTFRSEWRAGTQALFHERGALPAFVDGSLAPQTNLDVLGLDELKRFFDHPAKYFLREVLQVDMEVGSDGVNDDEVITISGLDKFGLRQSLFATARASGPLADEPTSLMRARGGLPPAPLDRESYRKLAGQMNELWSMWHDSRPEGEPEVVAIDLHMSTGMRVVGRIGDVRLQGLCRIEPRHMRASQLLAHWIDLLALAATGGTATLASCGFDGDGELDLRHGTIDTATAMLHLQSLVDVYLEGQRHPLLFLPGLGERYLRTLNKKGTGTPDEALLDCNKWLSNTYQIAWERKDPWFGPLLAEEPHPLGEDAATAELCRIAHTCMEPMLSTLQPLGKADWLAAVAAGLQT